MADGGPAFPNMAPHQVGMSLRDWFAGQALVGMGTWVPTNTWPDHAELCRLKAIFAYEVADAMLKAKEASNG